MIAAVFAVHPLHVESVAWIIERKDVLSALFYLTAVLVWVRFEESPGPGRYGLALALFAAGLLAKSVVVTVPAALLILQWWRRGRVTAVDLLRMAPLVAVGLAITLADYAFYVSREPLDLGYTLVERALIAARALWFYAGKLVWPADLMVIYPLWEIDARDPLAWAWVAGAAALWAARRRIGRGPLAGALFFAVTLAPVLGFVDFGYMQFSFVADRFQYLAGIGVLAVLIGTAAHAVGTLPERVLPERVRTGALGLAVALILSLAVLTYRRAGVYRDEITLFSHVVAHNPEARDAHHNLGGALSEAERFEEGLEVSLVYWEYFYGARSWLVPGAVAGVLRLFDAAGLGEPFWYVGGVKLAFCALSLAIPAAMYCVARRHFGETAARVALLAGAFWYELAGFAHKPLTEFVATAPLVGLLALSVRPAVDRPRTVWLAAALAVLAGAIRVQYAPVALVLLGIVFVRTPLKPLLALAAAASFLAVGIFDAVTWDGGLFHSYLTNLRYNLAAGGSLSGAGPAWQIPWWMLVAGGGSSLLCLGAALRWPRRYGLLLGLTALVLVIHSVPEHKEYRFVFAAIPLWLLIGSDLAARAAAWVARRSRERPEVARRALAAVGLLFAALSAAGLLKELPAQVPAYRAWSYEAGTYGFVRRQDPIFAAYRYLARAPGVGAVWQIDRPYSSTPGYYYLHRAIPLYDAATGRAVSGDLATLSATVTHLVSADPDLEVPGYALERQFGDVRILRRAATGPPVRGWRE